jgi:hypothetical protein
MASTLVPMGSRNSVGVFASPPVLALSPTSRKIGARLV